MSGYIDPQRRALIAVLNQKEQERLAQQAPPSPLSQALGDLAPTDPAAMQAPPQHVMSAQPTGYAPPPETLAQIGQRGPQALSPMMADIEHARGGVVGDVNAGAAPYMQTIARLKEEWKRDKARVMASPEYQFLQKSGLAYLIDN